jgi:hypothetical protein
VSFARSAEKQGISVVNSSHQKPVIRLIVAAGFVLPWITIIGSAVLVDIPFAALFDQVKSQTPFFAVLAIPLAILWTTPFLVLALLRQNLESMHAPSPLMRRVSFAAGLGTLCLLAVLFYGRSEFGAFLVVMVLSYAFVAIRSWNLHSSRARRILFLGGVSGATLGTLVAYGILIQLSLFGFYWSLTMPLVVLGATVSGLLVGLVLGKLFDRGPPMPISEDSTVGTGSLIILTNAVAGSIGAPIAVLAFSALAEPASLQHEARILLLNILPALVFTGAWLGWAIGLVLDAARKLAWPRPGTMKTPLAAASLGLLPALIVTLAPGFLGERVFLPLMANDYFVLLNRGHLSGQSVAISPDGSHFAALVRSTAVSREDSRFVPNVVTVLYVWEASTGELEFNVDLEATSTAMRTDRLVYSLDGRRIAAISDLSGTIVIDVETGRQLFSIDPATDGLATGDQVSNVAFSPDGERIALALTNGVAAIYDAANGYLVDALPIALDTAAVRSAAYSPDGRFLAIGGSHVDASGMRLGFTALLEVDTGTTHYVRDNVPGTVASLSFSPDGSRLLTMEIPGRAHIRDAMIGAPLAELDHQCQPLLDATFVADDATVITLCGQQAIYRCDAATGACMIAIRLKISEIKAASAYAADGRLVIAEGSRTISVWDWRTGEVLESVQIRAP